MMEGSKKHLPIEDMEMFLNITTLSDALWDLVAKWAPFAKDTVGKQMTRAIDSIGANLVEGDGRYSSVDAIHFLIIARGSARESRYWIVRAAKRGLISDEDAKAFLETLDHFTRSLNKLITYRRDQVGNSKIKEELAIYG